MITPEYIQEKAHRYYEKILTSSITKVNLFPLIIPFTHIKPSQTLEHYSSIQRMIQNVKEHSKEILGYGYTVEFQIINDRKIGKQYRPKKIYFETETDYIKYIEKEEEFKNFKKDIQKIEKRIPEISEWIKNNPKKVIECHGIWEEILSVLQYFQSNPKPNLYIRELPIHVDTKFIERNNYTIKILLDYLLKEENVNKEESSFEKRYFLKYKEPIVRLRSLDHAFSLDSNKVTDICLVESEFKKLRIEHSRILIVENEIIFLTLPKIQNCIAIFGKGFGVQSLKKANWLKDKDLHYWGDIDEHGFLILSQLRSYFPNVKSILMDKETYKVFETFAHQGNRIKTNYLENLTTKETEMFQYLINNQTKNRLEQEHITHNYMQTKLDEMF